MRYRNVCLIGGSVLTVVACLWGQERDYAEESANVGLVARIKELEMRSGELKKAVHELSKLNDDLSGRVLRLDATVKLKRVDVFDVSRKDIPQLWEEQNNYPALFASLTSWNDAQGREKRKRYAVVIPAGPKSGNQDTVRLRVYGIHPSE